MRLAVIVEQRRECMAGSPGFALGSELEREREREREQEQEQEQEQECKQRQVRCWGL